MNQFLRTPAVPAAAGVVGRARDRHAPLLRDHHDDAGRHARHRRRRLIFVIRYRARDPEAAAHPRDARAASAGLDRGGGRSSGCSACSSCWWAIGFAPVRAHPGRARRTRWTSTSPPSSGCGSSPTRTGTTRSRPLYVPAGRPVKLIMTSRDVIHSFYVPDFRVKQDVIPGRYTTAWFTVERAGHASDPVRGVLRRRPLADARRGRRARAGGLRALARAAPARCREPLAGRVDASADDRAPRRATRADPGARRASARPPSAAACAATRSTGRRTSARPGPGSTAPSCRSPTASVVIADEAYLTESMMDPLVKVHRGLSARDADATRACCRRREAAAIVEFIKSLRERAPARRSGAAARRARWPIAPVREGPTRPAAEPRPDARSTFPAEPMRRGSRRSGRRTICATAAASGRGSRPPITSASRSCSTSSSLMLFARWDLRARAARPSFSPPSARSWTR